MIDYPADLPPSRDATKPMNPVTAGAMVGLRYTDAGGTEWAGPATIHVESFSSDGVVHGTFDQVILPHTDDEKPDITLSGGSFSARISAPW